MTTCRRYYIIGDSNMIDWFLRWSPALDWFPTRCCGFFITTLAARAPSHVTGLVVDDVIVDHDHILRPPYIRKYFS